MINLNRYPVPTRFSEEEDYTGAFFKSQTVLSAGSTGASGLLYSPIYADKNVCGVLGLSTGTTATASLRVFTNSNCFELNGGKVIFCTNILIPTLFTVAQDGLVRIGIGNTLTATTADQDHVGGVYFEYDRSASVNWRLCTSSASTRTKTASAVVVANNTWLTLCFVVNSAGTSVDFYINKVLVGTNTTNIPLLTNLCYNWYLKKKAGTTAFVVLNDFYSIQKQLNKAR